MRVVTPAEMAEIDRAAIAEEGISGLELMERAGEEVAGRVREMLPGGGRVAVWCGKGNNGGDGLVAARLLAGGGYDVKVFLLAPKGDLKGDARVTLERLEGLSVMPEEVLEPEGISAFSGASPRFDLAVDSIFGTGFTGNVTGVFAAAVEAINSHWCAVLSVDIPSGVSGSTGAVEGPAVRAGKTVSFAAPKVGLVQYPGAAYAGELEIADIGIPDRLIDEVPGSDIRLMTEEVAQSLIPERAPDAHKRQCGSVLVVGGSPGMTGAAALCADAAMRSGAGLVTVGVPERFHDILEIKLTEVMTMPLPQTPEGLLSYSAHEVIAGRAGEFDTLAIGPGLGVGDESAECVRKLVAGVDIPMVIDADGLNAIAGSTELLRARDGVTVLTPHPGEMARLLSCSTKDVQADRVAAVIEGASRWGVVVVLKGAGTLVAEPGGRVRINTTGNPGMASAGMGDVLTGCIAAFTGQGLNPFDAATAGVYFHGLAGDLAAGTGGAAGVMAGEVARRIPLALRKGP